MVISVRRDPMPDGGYVATFTDITQRKQAEAALAEKSALINTTFENMIPALARRRQAAWRNRYG